MKVKKKKVSATRVKMTLRNYLDFHSWSALKPKHVLGNKDMTFFFSN